MAPVPGCELLPSSDSSDVESDVRELASGQPRAWRRPSPLAAALLLAAACAALLGRRCLAPAGPEASPADVRAFQRAAEEKGEEEEQEETYDKGEEKEGGEEEEDDEKPVYPFQEATHDDYPSLFCWLISQTVGDEDDQNIQGWWEEKLVWEMMYKQIGIFACNDYAVMTDRRVDITKMERLGWPYVEEDYVAKEGEILSWAIGSTAAPKNKDTSPANNNVFVTAWKAIKAAKVLEGHQWVVKQDPDAVMFPWRLRWHAAQWGNKDGLVPMFIKNCITYDSMQGPLEIFSISLVKKMIPVLDECGEDKPGEDGKMEVCAKQFAEGKMDATALEDKYCKKHKSDCKSGDVIAYHPFKYLPHFQKCADDSILFEQRYQEKQKLGLVP